MTKQIENKIDALTSNDLEKIADLLNTAFDTRLEPLATKDFVKEQIDGVKGDLKATEEDLKAFINEGMDTILKGIDHIVEMLAEKERVERLEKWAEKVSEKVGIKLEN